MSRNLQATTVAEVLDDTMLFERRTLRAVRAFKRQKPWRGELQQRREKINALHAELCTATGKATTLRWNLRVPADADSGGSYYDARQDRITLLGRPSVVTYLHMFARALGNDRIGAFRWSLNLFRKMFPISWSRLVIEGLMVRRRPNVCFDMGRIVSTPAAMEALAAAGQDAEFFLTRHARGDWGDLDAHDIEANAAGLRDGERLLSAYTTLGGTRLYVITEADRSATTVLLPEEY